MALDFVIDIETYPNVFTMAAEHVETGMQAMFEISPWRNDSVAIISFLHSVDKVIGFNVVGFDYPVLHMLIQMQGKATALTLYNKAQEIIASQQFDRWKHIVYPSDRYCELVDLYLIHHFDNNARATSLKVIEFNMRMDTIQDLLFPVGTVLNYDQTQVLKVYNKHDIKATKRFYFESMPMIEFRRELSIKTGKDFTNYNDTKIGKQTMQMYLEAAGVQCYEYGPAGRQPRQTKRPSIALKDIVFPWVTFVEPEFNRILTWFKAQTITETKGVFKGLTAHVDGMEFVFGTGGLHASVDNGHFVADEEYMILDVDVSAMYPSIAIAHKLYPQHLGEKFVDIYADIRDQRARHKKGTPENAMLKLALNGVYGDSNSKFSIFYDPAFTMSITINGQLMLCMLAEQLVRIDRLMLIQCNTDGLTMYVRRDQLANVKAICQWWEGVTGLTLEEAEYSRMWVRDVNNYLAEYVDGKVKRKGAYEHAKEWHQDQSALIVAKATEDVLVRGMSPRDAVMRGELMDFMLRIKVPRTGRLLWGEEPIQNTTRYYISREGKTLVKMLPPLKGKTDWRRFNVQSGWKVQVANDMAETHGCQIDYDWYIAEVEKLVFPVS